MAREPTFQTHATGVHFTRWNRRQRWFTKDRTESLRLFDESKALYHLWKATGVDHDPPRPRHGDAGPGPAAEPPQSIPLPPGPPRTIAALGVRFMESNEVTVSPRTYEYYRKHLSRALNLWGALPLLRHDRLTRSMQCTVGAPELEALKEDMRRPCEARPRGYDPVTVNHDIVAVKRLFNYAEEREFIPKNRCAKVRRLPVEPPRDKSIPAPVIRVCMVGVCLQGAGARCLLPTRKQRPPTAADPNLAAWLELTYYALLRPSETVKVVHREGSFEDRYIVTDGELGADVHGRPIRGGECGVFRLHTSKTSKRSQTPRRVLLSPRAMLALGSASPAWPDLESYLRAVTRLCGPGGPHPLRHSGATHLGLAGVAAEDIDSILGHLRTRVSRTYNPGTWRPLIARAARLAL
jgi:site-specific recombinase XerD